MKTFMLAFVATAAFATASVAGLITERAFAQEAGAAQEMATTTGELLSVDLDAQTLSLRAGDGTTWSFTFTDDTQVNGSSEGTAGLATMAGTTVTVHYVEEAGGFAARVIDIEAAE